MRGTDLTLEYSAEAVKSTVCMKGTDFEHQVYWLEAEGDPTRWRYLTDDEEQLYAADKVALDEADRERRQAAVDMGVTGA